MERKIGKATIMIAVFLMSMALMANLPTVKASGTIYIRADGSIDPPTAPISTVDTVTYTFTDNINDSVIVERSDIIINGAGYTLQGPPPGSGWAFEVSGIRNVTIKNTIIIGPIGLGSPNNIISGNTITDNSWIGISIAAYSSNNIISGNTITNNFRGIEIDSSNNIISGNNITNNAFGIVVALPAGMNNNIISGNNITNNGFWSGYPDGCGIGFWSTDNQPHVSDNKVYHNNFVANQHHVNVASGDTIIWDDGYPSGGNYWSDYNGTDLFNGLYQNETGSDNIGDSPCIIDSNNTDNFPLMKPYVPFENQTIYIRADGSVDPSGAPILRKGNLYTLTDNITSNSGGIVVERDNIVVDGAGYTLQGSGAPVGIDLSGRENVTVRKTQITAFECGIYLEHSSNSSISGNNITNNWWGINSYPYPSNHNSIDGNNITNNAYGMELYSSPYSSVSGNNITNNGYGIELDYSSNCSISGNTFTADGIYLVDSYLNSVENNIVNGKPLVYLEGVADYSVGDAGQVVLVNCDSIRVENLNLALSTIGLQLLKTNNTIISGNNITYNSVSGILLESSSSYNSIIGNNITGNYNGIWLSRSSNNSISENNITADWFGIWLQSSSYNSLSGNKIAASLRCGIDLQSSSSNSIIGNDITANDYYGILLWYSSNYNSIIGNNITANNGFGIYLDSSTGYSSYNSIFHNNFINNTNQVYSTDSANVWDDGYPSGGNYWSDYTGVDIEKGPTQDQPGSDNIGDTPYVIDTDNVDHYPLMNPYGSPPPPTYSLTITATAGGTTNPPPGTNTYSQGQTVPVQAAPNIGYVFDHWELDNVSVGAPNPISVTMNSSYTLNAVFSWAGICNLTINATAGGTTSPTPETYSYTNGTSAEVTAIPDTGYGFDHWELNDSWNYSNPITVTMDSDHALHAVFTYTVTIAAYCYNEQANVGVAISMDGNSTGYVTPHTFTNLSGTHTFTIPGVDAAGHSFWKWNTGTSAGTITVSTGGPYMAFYQNAGVGFFVVPVDKLGLLSPYIGLASTILVATVATAIYVKRVKHTKEKQ